MYSTADEVSNIKSYFEDEHPSRFLDSFRVTEATRVQKMSSGVKLTLFFLLVSAAIPLPPDVRDNTSQQAEEPSNYYSHQKVDYKLSRSLRLKLTTRKYDELAPFYRYLALFVLLVALANFGLEIKTKQALFRGSWKLYDHFSNICNETSVKDDIRADRLSKFGDTVFLIGTDHCENDIAKRNNYTEYNAHLCVNVRCDISADGTTSFGYGPDTYSPELWFFFQPPYFYRENTKKLFFVNSSLNMLSLLFLGLAVMSRPKQPKYSVVDVMYIAFTLLSHATLLYNLGFVINRDFEFKLSYQIWEGIYSLGNFLVLYLVTRRCRR